VTTRAEEYAVQSDHFLEKAEEALAEYDLVQASEKLWGAAAQAVKAAAESRGWSHNGHRELFDVVNRLAQEYDDPKLRDLFQIANSLHINFYENWLTKEYIDDGVARTHEFIGEIQRIQG
jgi:hypothetical protein